MRNPTPDHILYEWWRAAMSGERMPTHEDEPQCGLFKCRTVSRGPFVPARIFVAREVCGETGDLLSDETLMAEVNGEIRDPHQVWVWLAKYPISQDEWDDLQIMSRELNHV